MKLAQISDFHWTRAPLNPLGFCSKRLIGVANWLVNRKGIFSEKALEVLPETLQEMQVDRVLLGGDFTSTALAREFAAARKFVERLKAPWIAIPGNHDCYTVMSFLMKRFYRSFRNPKPHGGFQLEREGVEAHHLKDGWWLVAIDTARPSLMSRGHFSKKLEGHLRRLLAQLPPKDSILVFNHYPFFQNDLPSRSLVRSDALETLVREDKRIRAYLHGHTHRHIIADLQSAGYPIVLDGGCAAFTERGSWNLLDLDECGMTVDVVRWDGKRWSVERTERITWMR